MKISKIFLSIYLFLLCLTSHNGIAADQKDFIRLVNALTQTAEVAASSDTSTGEVKAQIHDLLEMADQICRSNCGVVLDTMSEVNGALERGDVVQTIEIVAKSTSLESQLTDSGAKELIAGVQKFVKEQDPEEVVKKGKAAIEVLKFTHSIYGKLLEDPTKNAEEIKELTTRATKQISAIYKIVEIVRKVGVIDLVDINKQDAGKIVEAVHELGAFYMKLAQSVSNLGSVTGEELSQQLKTFQDAIPPMKESEAKEIIEREFGKSVDKVFVEIDLKNPIAAGTIGQAHRAKIRTLTGIKSVIVKIQRPNLEKDLEYTDNLNRIAWKAFKVAYQVHPFFEFMAEQVFNLTDVFKGELDFRSEGAQLDRFRNYFRFHRKTKLPRVFWKQTSKMVLTMEAVPGQNIDSFVEGMRKIDPSNTIQVETNIQIKKQLYATILDAFLYQTLVVREIHADMHPGNILGRTRGTIDLIDLSQTVSTRGLITVPLLLLSAFATGNHAKFAKIFERIALNTDYDSAALSKKIGELFSEHSVESRKLVKGLFSINGNSFETFGNILKDSIEFGIKEANFRLDPKYVQFGRSIVPVFATLFSLSEGVSGAEIRKITLWKLALAYPAGIPLYAASLPGALMNKLINSVRMLIIKRRAGCSYIDQIFGN